MFVNNELLVSLKDGVLKSQLEDVLYKIGGKIVAQNDYVNECQIQLDKEYSYRELELIQKDFKQMILLMM